MRFTTKIQHQLLFAKIKSAYTDGKNYSYDITLSETKWLDPIELQIFLLSNGLAGSASSNGSRGPYIRIGHADEICVGLLLPRAHGCGGYGSYARFTWPQWRELMDAANKAENFTQIQKQQ